MKAYIKKSINFCYLVLRRIMQKIFPCSYSDAMYISSNKMEFDKELKWYIPKTKVNLLTLEESSIILINDMRDFLKWSFIKNIHKTKIIDPEFYDLVEVSNWTSLLFSTYSDSKKDELIQVYKNNYKRLIKKYKTYNQSSIFLSGPSIESYNKFDFSNSINIICNSLVKNKELLAYVKPDILVFADPVFHFSHNEYAQKFREDMIETVKEYDCFVIVPEVNAPILLAHYPWLEKNIIAFPFKSNINFPIVDDFYVKGTDNILTLFMLPIASVLTNEIYIIGADGRKKDETYFWKHNSDVQYDGLMQKAFDAHPSFFRDRDYNKYYESHCDTLDQMIIYGEKKEKSYFSLTKSNIPSLANRYTPEGLK